MSPFHVCAEAGAAQRARASGFTLVELLVGLVLGLLVTLAAGSMLLSANVSFTAQTEAARVDAAGRFALEAIERAARQSAYVDWDRDDAAPGTLDAEPARVGGLDDSMLARSTAGLGSAGAGAIGGSDVLALRFAGAGEGADGDGSVISCAGFSVGAGQEGWSIFYVAANADGVAELRCKYRGEKNWSADALVAGVDSFQVLYGLDTDEPRDGIANRYVRASTIEALDAALILDGESDTARARDFNRKTHWKRVAGIKVALLLHGAKRSRTGGDGTSFDLFGPSYRDATDTGARVVHAQLAPDLQDRERRAFAATILLRNAAM